MSRSGYFTGPYDEYRSRLAEEGEVGAGRNSDVMGKPGRECGMIKPASVKVRFEQEKADALQTRLDELLERERHFEKQIETALEQVADKKNAIANYKSLLKKAELALEELCSHGRHIEHNLERVRDKIIKVKEQIKTENENRIFAREKSAGVSRPAMRTSAHELSHDYYPRHSVVEALMQFHQIPVAYIEEKLIEFRIHYTETCEKRLAWDRTFYTWVVNGWKREKHKEAITDSFVPDRETREKIFREGVSPEFCEQEIKGFVLYWQEHNARFTPKLWQERFRQWILRAWQRYQDNEEYSRPSYPTTAEFADTKRADRYQFRFEEDEED